MALAWVVMRTAARLVRGQKVVCTARVHQGHLRTLWFQSWQDSRQCVWSTWPRMGCTFL